VSTLNVYFRDTLCALLTESAGGELQFRYLDSWIEEGGFPICTRLPLEPHAFEHETVAPFVASFLPEGETLRSRLDKLLHVVSQHDFGLLAAMGRESAGALSFWPEGEEKIEAPGYAPLTDEEFGAWKEYAHDMPLQFPGHAIRLSLAGAQPKTALYFDEEEKPWLPEQGAPTTHIIKPRIPGCQPSSVFVEWITMQLARAVLGEDQVPKTDLWRNCYRVRRFDRTREGGVVQRLHQEDFCLALGRMPAQKYESERKPENALSQCFDLIDRLGEMGRIRSPAIQRLRLLDQVILNILLHNPDAHLKNYALLYGEDSTLEVSSLYDCLCTYNMKFAAEDVGAWEQGGGPAVHTTRLSLRIGNATRIDQVAMADWELFAEECGFTQAFVRRRVKSSIESVEQSLTGVLECILKKAPNAQPAVDLVREAVSRQLICT
jgi:serine/threonine-protein kinase HipA